MSRRARARAGAINAKRIAFTPDPESAEDDDGTAFDLHGDDYKAWAWAQAVSAASARMRRAKVAATPSLPREKLT